MALRPPKKGATVSPAIRIIPCLDVSGGRVVKGVNFVNLADAGDPVELSRRYYEQGADEITFLDISATVQERRTTYDMVEKTAENVFVPLTVGGGIRSLDDVATALAAGADKVGINTAALNRPELLNEVATHCGRQVVTLSVDARADAACPSGYEVTTHGGRQGTGVDMAEWITEASERGAGEILLTSMDADGTRNGFDLPMLKVARNCCQLPIIASGGAGSVDHCVAAAEAGADAVLAASIFHFGTLTIAQVKEGLDAAGFEVRQ